MRRHSRLLACIDEDATDGETIPLTDEQNNINTAATDEGNVNNRVIVRFKCTVDSNTETFAQYLES